ncbi:hypothetical protein CS063_15410 [Sporanaerobium hydrogeniformans]|uniref:Uncharacterized protein n=1 Tax=Sporanaerobium hydrogeniformans TaxID=3072179 RepID=A0AC61D814_9FIRM|nr:RecX family transcriptional regulator [Sporanaerobium hydrogeniformans]PHV69509.1 hypothetical protein CS063_15410 [Sporanaerobium hydrogeniformans]
MKKITKISSQQHAERYNLFLDEAFFCGISEDTLVKLGLKKGMEIEEETLRALIEEEGRNQCFHYALWLLERQNYFEKVLRNKLKAKEYTEEQIDFAIEKLNSYGYLDEERLVNAFVNDKKRFSKKGPYYIKEALRQKGVSTKKITEALNTQYSEEEELENCKLAAEKKLVSYRRKESNMYILKGKLYSFLMQRGFGADTIAKVIELVLKENNE